MPTRKQVWKPYRVLKSSDGGGLAIGTNSNAANSNKNENSNSNTTQVVRKDGMDYTNYNNTNMQQRIALARANSGYIALPEKQTNRRTTNNSKRAQTSPTAPLLLEHTKRITQNPAKVVFDVEIAPPRPSYIASKSELDEATSVQKGDNDSDEDSCDRTCDEEL